MKLILITLVACALIVTTSTIFAQTSKTPLYIQTVRHNDTSLSEQVNALQVQVQQLAAQVASLNTQLTQATKLASDANLKASLATNWIDTNGDTALKAANWVNTNGGGVMQVVNAYPSPNTTITPLQVPIPEIRFNVRRS